MQEKVLKIQFDFFLGGGGGGRVSDLKCRICEATKVCKNYFKIEYFEHR